MRFLWLDLSFRSTFSIKDVHFYARIKGAVLPFKVYESLNGPKVERGKPGILFIEKNLNVTI
jgi:hypothetical protein